MVIQKPLKKVYKASESMNVGCCRLCKSVGDTRNLGEIFTAKPESTTSGRGRGAFIPACSIDKIDDRWSVVERREIVRR